ncbi:ATP-grasp peptide maturase system methyltransferase [Pseudonocardia saturnea]
MPRETPDLQDLPSREELRARLVEQLTGHGGLDLDPEWAAAFAAVPRELFVPEFFIQRPGEPGWLSVTDPDPTWLPGVYSPAALITQIGADPANAERARSGRVDGPVTSSSSAPPLMAAMLQHLQVRDGHTVLEIGTGTGYNAALLSHRLGPDRVTSIDVDEHLIDTARQRLAHFGHHPHLLAADGEHGHPQQAPFDRLIATVAVTAVPTAWTEQTRPGGRMIVPLDLAGRGGLLAALDVTAPGRAHGRFLPIYGGFMSLRAHQHHAQTALTEIGASAPDGQERATAVPVEVATDAANPFECIAGLRTGGYDWLGFTPGDGSPAQTWLVGRDGSWACHSTDTHGRSTVRQGGPAPLWDSLEAAHQEWTDLGAPPRERYGLTVEGEHHTLWLDNPDGPRRWDLHQTT